MPLEPFQLLLFLNIHSDTIVAPQNKVFKKKKRLQIPVVDLTEGNLFSDFADSLDRKKSIFSLQLTIEDRIISTGLFLL